MRRKNKIVGLVVLFFMFACSGVLRGQVRISSPYSRYGLGEITGCNFARTMAMGGLGYAVRDKYMVNMLNPASYSGFDTLSFVCDVGLTANFMQLQTIDTAQGFNEHTTFGYLVFGFPVTRWWGASLGLVPYSRAGYKLLAFDSIEGAGKYKGKYEGEGGLNRFFIGSGFRLHRDLSLGFNVSFLFGTLKNISSVYLLDLPYVFDTRITNYTVINDFHFEAGLQYHHQLKKNYFINAGLVYQLPFGMKARKTHLVERFTASSSGYENTMDTVEYFPSQKGIIHLPGSIGGGVVVGQNDVWMIGLDVAWQNWKKYSSFGSSDSLKSSLHTAVGCMITPVHSSVSNYFRKMSYRAGFRYENTYLDLHDYQITEYGVSVGFGFPVRKSASSINVAFEYGQRGTTKYNLIKETFIRATLGVTIKEFWFFRRKLD